jgi:hypothetical protein
MGADVGRRGCGVAAEVTSYCDWCGISDSLRERLPRWPIVPKMALITTLEEVDARATNAG